MATFFYPSTVVASSSSSSSSSFRDPSSSSLICSSFQPRSFASFNHLRTHRRTLRPVVFCELNVVAETNSLSSAEDEPSVGSKIRVLGPLTVYHVPKQPRFELGGCEGEIKDVLKIWKGKSISANFPYKVQFNLDLEGKPVKFIAHLKENEFEVIG